MYNVRQILNDFMSGVGKVSEIDGSFVKTFLGFDGSAAEVYSSIYPKLEGLGRIPQEFDLQIASIAIANNLILVTRNTKDFESICQVSNLMLENWFEMT